MGGVSLSSLYPIGSVYISVENTGVCPLESLGIGTWTELGSGRVLQTVQGSQQAGDVVEAGLPNIEGAAGFGSHFFVTNTVCTGAFAGNNVTPKTDNEKRTEMPENGSTQFLFAASRSNSIYGKSSTVQPPAILVKAWKRVA